MPKNVHTTTQLHSFHTLPKKCWKFSKLGFNSMWPKNFQMFKLPGGSEGKASACNLEDLCSIPEEGISWEDPLEKEMATHSSILAWRIPWTEEPGRLQFRGSQGVRHDWATFCQPPFWSLYNHLSPHLIPLFSLDWRKQVCQNPKPWALPLLGWVFVSTEITRESPFPYAQPHTHTHTHTHTHFFSQDALNVYQLLWHFYKKVMLHFASIKWSLLITYPSLVFGLLMIESAGEWHHLGLLGSSLAGQGKMLYSDPHSRVF